MAQGDNLIKSVLIINYISTIKRWEIWVILHRFLCISKHEFVKIFYVIMEDIEKVPSYANIRIIAVLQLL